MADYKIGDPVVFGRRYGEKTRGTIVKVNRKTCKVRQEEARGTMKNHPVGTVWTVPLSLIGPDQSNRSDIPELPKRPISPPFGPAPIAKCPDGITDATIVRTRSLTNAELTRLGWDENKCGKPMALVLDNYAVLYAVRNEGNSAEAFFGIE